MSGPCKLRPGAAAAHSKFDSNRTESNPPLRLHSSPALPFFCVPLPPRRSSSSSSSSVSSFPLAMRVRWHCTALGSSSRAARCSGRRSRRDEMSSPPRRSPLSVCPQRITTQPHPTTLRHSTPTRSHSSTAHAALCPLDWMSESAGQRGAAAAAASSAAAAGVSRARAARPTRKLEGASAGIDSDEPIDLVSDADSADVWGASSGGESDSDEAADRREAREDDMRRRVDHTKTFRTTRGWPRKMASGQMWREVSRKRTKESAQPASQLGQPAQLNPAASTS